MEQCKVQDARSFIAGAVIARFGCLNRASCSGTIWQHCQSGGPPDVDNSPHQHRELSKLDGTARVTLLHGVSAEGVHSEGEDASGGPA